MKFFVILFIFSLPLAHAKALTCDELRPILNELERTLMKKTAKDCQSLDAKKLIPESKEGFPSAEQQTILDNYRCKDISEIELHLRRVENDLALIEGLKALKNDIEEDKEIVKSENTPTAQEAAKSFVANLQIAKHLELLLNTESGQGTFLHYLATLDENQWQTPGKLSTLAKNHCKENPPEENEVNICHAEFAPDQSVFDEIRAFVALGKETDGRFNSQHVDDLEDALAIQKEGKEYSYMAMYLEIKDQIKADGTMSSGALKAINGLPPITNSDKAQYLEKMNRAKASLIEQQTPLKFKFFLSDLRSRQEWEFKGKLSLVMDEFKDLINSKGLKEVCDKALTLEFEAKTCLGPLGNAAPGDTRGAYLGKIDDKSGMIGELLETEEQIRSLKDKETSCIPNKERAYPDDCYSAVLTQEESLIEKALVLKELKDRILEENSELQRYRDFAIESFQNLSCPATESSITDCYGTLNDAISMESIVLADNVKDIVIVQNKKSTESDISDLCEDEASKVFNKEKLCSYFNQEEQEETPSVAYHAPTNTGRASAGLGSSVAEVIGKLGNYAAGLLAPRPPQMQMYPGPIINGPALTISQRTIISSQISTGIGFYPVGPGRGASSSYFNYPK